jgi:hypothetical protein
MAARRSRPGTNPDASMNRARAVERPVSSLLTACIQASWVAWRTV